MILHSLKEQLDNFRNNKIHLFKKSQHSNSTCAAYQDLISFAGVSANKVEKLHFDETTKNGRSYSTFYIANQEGKLLICGLWKVGVADAKSQLDLICEILDGVCSSLENKDEVINNTFINVKNLKSDRCNTQKSFISCLWSSEKTF